MFFKQRYFLYFILLFFSSLLHAEPQWEDLGQIPGGALIMYSKGIFKKQPALYFYTTNGIAYYSTQWGFIQFPLHYDKGIDFLSTTQNMPDLRNQIILPDAFGNIISLVRTQMGWSSHLDTFAIWRYQSDKNAWQNISSIPISNNRIPTNSYEFLFPPILSDYDPTGHTYALVSTVPSVIMLTKYSSKLSWYGIPFPEGYNRPGYPRHMITDQPKFLYLFEEAPYPDRSFLYIKNKQRAKDPFIDTQLTAYYASSHNAPNIIAMDFDEQGNIYALVALDHDRSVDLIRYDITLQHWTTLQKNIVSLVNYSLHSAPMSLKLIQQHAKPALLYFSIQTGCSENINGYYNLASQQWTTIQSPPELKNKAIAAYYLIGDTLYALFLLKSDFDSSNFDNISAQLWQLKDALTPHKDMRWQAIPTPNGAPRLRIYSYGEQWDYLPTQIGNQIYAVSLVSAKNRSYSLWRLN